MSRGYETRDVNFKPVLWASFGVSAVVVGSFALMWLLYVSLVAREERDSAPAHSLAKVYGRSEPPAPQLQKDPFADWEALQRESTEILSTYGWVDRSSGVVRIPIERAMELALDRGFLIRSDRGLRGDPDPKFEAYVREQQEAPAASAEPEPAEQPRRKRERKRGDR